jgi:hypothetical protein
MLRNGSRLGTQRKTKLQKMEELLRSGAGAKTDDKIQKRIFHCTLHDYNRFSEVIVISPSFNYWNKNLEMQIIIREVVMRVIPLESDLYV